MMSSITGGPGIVVSNSTSPGYVNMSMPSAGMMRFNGSNMEVYDGHSWLQISSSSYISLDPEVQAIVDWAKIKMREEEDLKRRMKEHPGLKDAWEKFKIVDALTTEQLP